MTLPLNPFKKIAKQNGVKRISQKACELLAQYCEEYTIELIKKAQIFSENSNRTTILERDVESAKKRES